jgi:hypothetical protein
MVALSPVPSSMYRDRDPNVWTTAGFMFAKFGRYAPEIAQQRARLRSERHAHKAAQKWTTVGEICRALVATSTSRSAEEVNIESVLNEPMTQQLIEADEREQQGLERIALHRTPGEK